MDTRELRISAVVMDVGQRPRYRSITTSRPTNNDRRRSINWERPISTAFALAGIVVLTGEDAVFTGTISVAADGPWGTHTCENWALIDGEPMVDATGAIIYETKTIDVPVTSLTGGGQIGGAGDAISIERCVDDTWDYFPAVNLDKGNLQIHEEWKRRPNHVERPLRVDRMSPPALAAEPDGYFRNGHQSDHLDCLIREQADGTTGTIGLQDGQWVEVWCDAQYAARKTTPITPKTTADRIRSVVASMPAARTKKTTEAAILRTPSVKNPAGGNLRAVIRIDLLQKCRPRSTFIIHPLG